MLPDLRINYHSASSGKIAIKTYCVRKNAYSSTYGNLQEFYLVLENIKVPRSKPGEVRARYTFPSSKQFLHPLLGFLSTRVEITVLVMCSSHLWPHPEHVWEIVCGMFAFMFLASRLDVQNSKLVSRRGISIGVEVVFAVVWFFFLAWHKVRLSLMLYPL